MPKTENDKLMIVPIEMQELIETVRKEHFKKYGTQLNQKQAQQVIVNGYKSK
jgi:hypothetical protein